MADAAAESGRLLREQGDELRATAAALRDGLVETGRAPDAGQRESACPMCGQPMLTGSGCNVCFGGSLEQASADFSAAEERWEAAGREQHAADRTRELAEEGWTEAETSWKEAEARHSRARDVRDEARQRWDESQKLSEQAAVDWESAQTLWARAQERVEPAEG